MLTSFDLKHNYYALTVAILAPATPEMAFLLMEEDKQLKLIQVCRKDITPEDDRDMAKMHRMGLFYRHIGEIYLISSEAARARISRIELRGNATLNTERKLR